MKWWVNYAYNLDNGTRAILGLYNSETPPQRRSPFYYSDPIKTKWIEAMDADITGADYIVTIRKTNQP